MFIKAQRAAGLIAACALALATSARAQAPTDRIHGTVRDDSARAVVGATIHVTRGPDRAVMQTSTDSSGAYAVRFENGTGDYLVAVSAVGYKSVRRRIQRQLSETDFTADFVLQPDQTTLAAVTVTATTPTRASNRVGPFTQDPGASERWAEGVTGQVPPSMAGDIAAQLGAVPGLTMGPGGASILGAGGESNLTTLNGMALPGGTLPRAARTDTRVSGATFDPTRGGFSGASVDVRLAAGSRSYQQRQAFMTMENHALQANDAVGRSIGLPYDNLRMSAGADGELIRRALTYNVSVDFSRQTSDPATLIAANADAFAANGIARDSAIRAIGVARSLGIPLGGGTIPTARENTTLTWLGRFDDTRDSLDTRTLTTYLNESKAGAIGFGALTAPAAGGRQTLRNMGAQLQFGTYFGPGRRILNETNLAAGQSRTDGSPYLRLPGASVLVQSTGPEAGIATLGLGGNAALEGRSTRTTVEGGSTTIWNAVGRRHTFKTLAWLRTDAVEQTGGADLLGRYTFNSIADLAAGRAASYSRALVQPERSGSVWNGAAAFAHSFAPTRFFNMMYGARLEANGFASAPAANPAAEAALGVRTGVAPSRVHLSPRIGFSYLYSRAKDNGNAQTMNSLGSFFRPAAGMIRGGIGEFRDLLSPNVAADVRSRTGLAGSSLSLSCIGDAVPAPDWNTFMTSPDRVPGECTGGGGILAERAPGVSLLDPTYDVPRTWKATAEWNTSFGWLMFRLGGLVSYGFNQPGTTDANFAGVQRFTLPGEANRPVFVPTGAIDPGSGAVSGAESRRAADFGRVAVRMSDLRNYGQQVTLSLAPDLMRARKVPGNLYVSAAYTLQRARREFRGFDGAAFGDPRTREWAADPADARHIFVIQGGFSASYAGTFTFFGRAQSGLPFTPIVQGDVNGDGRGGDRAVVPNPATEADAALRAQMQSLVATGSPAARECITAWAGRVAGRNGCRGPWTATLNAQWRPYLPIGDNLRWRFTTAVYFENILGGLDQMLHGSDLHGWGGAAMPDPVLLVPRGFDPAARRFSYAVNPRFAETRPRLTSFRSPFRVTIDISMNLSTDYNLQSLRRALEPVKVAGRWERRTADSLTSYYLARTSDIFQVLLSQSDSLFLTREQIRSIRAADSVYAERVRAIYRPLGTYLAQFRDGVATKPALDSVAAAEKAYWKVFWEQPEIADSLVTPLQRELMPMLTNLLRVPSKEREQSHWYFGSPVKLGGAREPNP